MRSRHTAFPLGLLLAGCGIDLVGSAAPDAGTLPEAGPGPVGPPRTPDSGADPDPADADAGGDAAPVDAGPCGACSGAARQVCVEGACVEARRVFVSSTGSTAEFGATPAAALAAADARCQTLATAAKLGGTWKAWLSVNGAAAKDRLEHATVPYRLLDGTVVTSTFDDLLRGLPIVHAINRDEHASVVIGEQEVWTGTDSYGAKTSDNCNDFTSKVAPGPVAMVGLLSERTTSWTAHYKQFCDRTLQHIYCFEQ